MRTYYFDRKDGVPVRDDKGLEFPSSLAAVDHSKKLARGIRAERPAGPSDQYIAVLDESGTEIHCEPIYPA
jgi:hypothetical protein